MRNLNRVILWGITSFIIVFVICSFLPAMFSVIMMVLWLMLMMLFIMHERAGEGSVRDRLESAGERGVFHSQIDMLVRNYDAIHGYEAHFFEYGEDSSGRKAYDLIAAQMDNIIESAIKYLKTYNYYTRPIPSFLEKLVAESVSLVRKLNDLQSLMIQVEDATSDVDVSYVDDLLDSLREMRDN